ncbi:FUN14 domain-containing protein 1-like [Centruroides sculpturatus]|uniref:FUN14 domain-containing protein 1-like n=1 Tax=Centruroides sculpturatus TaxID=218467 RepID=UPI000C6E5B2C|nr:FUN14 domain-containing protein 1-like [Centruroides sculpturatus]XP_023229642.1 FUN14 domain-containing protein 1-like [Centruroides sculpturatus]
MKIESVDIDLSSKSINIDIKKKPKDKNGWLRATLDDISKASTAKQLTVGGLSGWCSGYLFTKVGKVAAAAVAGSIIFLQIAQYRGYIKVNWTTVNKDLNKAKQNLEKEAKNRLPQLVNEGQKFVEENVVLVTGFAGGFLLGLASA